MFSLTRALGAAAVPDSSPLNTVYAFITAMNQGRYKLAYSYISKPLQEQMTYGDFIDAAERVKSIHLLSVNLIRQTPRMAKARVTVESFEKDENGNQWKKRKHIGELVFIPEKGKWKVIQVDIKHFPNAKRQQK